MDTSARRLSCAVAALGAVLLHCASASAQAGASRPEIMLTAQQLASRTGFFQGEAGMASAQNFTSGLAAERLEQRQRDLFPWVEERARLVRLDVWLEGDTDFRFERDLVLTRDYLAYPRRTMGQAVADLDGFDDAYAKTDWSRFKQLPAFEPANRIDTSGTYLRMEQEALEERKP